MGHRQSRQGPCEGISSGPCLQELKCIRLTFTAAICPSRLCWVLGISRSSLLVETDLCTHCYSPGSPVLVFDLTHKLSAHGSWGISGNKVLVHLDLIFLRHLEQCPTPVRQRGSDVAGG